MTYYGPDLHNACTWRNLGNDLGSFSIVGVGGFSILPKPAMWENNRKRASSVFVLTSSKDRLILQAFLSYFGHRGRISYARRLIVP